MTVVLLFLDMMMLMGHMISASPKETTKRVYKDDMGRECQLCPPGFYQSDCDSCSPCPSDSYTNDWNREDTCFDCYRDCRDEFNLQVVQECNSKSDLKCSCKDGFTCTEFEETSSHCMYCVLNTPSTSPPVIKRQTETSYTSAVVLNVSSGNFDTRTKPAPQISPGNSSHDTYNTGGHHQVWYLILVVGVVMTVVAVTAIYLIWKHGREACLKRFVKQCSHDRHKGENDTTAHKTREAGQLFPKETHWIADPLTNPKLDCHIDLPVSTDQPPKATGNLGPFHIYSAGTVFVSLLNQVTNSEREREGEKMAQSQNREGHSPPPAPPSPPVPLSEEERNGEEVSIFFPSQEQGKESHLSKEEVM
ncbi:tumor necrosis factor receptor superfamily member 3 [Megalops cyprinoides]|uniref:tumor necrosis factor receptor superfamily member 3 n=1 Tax=Megalops cyprinoides TaxID=118141 RepID=UPI001863C1FF|nr:tumor necrosis factor receptor superfamily member 3 [Megalops cyprinoides]